MNPQVTADAEQPPAHSDDQCPCPRTLRAPAQALHVCLSHTGTYVCLPWGTAAPRSWLVVVAGSSLASRAGRAGRATGPIRPDSPWHRVHCVISGAPGLSRGHCRQQPSEACVSRGTPGAPSAARREARRASPWVSAGTHSASSHSTRLLLPEEGAAPALVPVPLGPRPESSFCLTSDSKLRFTPSWQFFKPLHFHCMYFLASNTNFFVE